MKTLNDTEEGGVGTDTPDMDAAAVRDAMNEDMEKALTKDRQAFDRKFDAIQETLEEMKGIVTRSSDRILSAIESGPHDRIIDTVCAAVFEADMS